MSLAPPQPSPAAAAAASRSPLAGHVAVTLALFRGFAAPTRCVDWSTADGTAQLLPAALGVIYTESAKLIRSLAHCGHLPNAIHPQTSSAPPSSYGLYVAASPMDLVEDLTLLTSMSCLLAKSPNNFHTLRNPTCVALALAAYWAEACLIAQLEVAEEAQIRAALAFVLSFKATRNAAADMHGDLRLALANSKTDSVLLSDRLRQTACVAMAHPLMFAVQLSLAMRWALERKLGGPRCPPALLTNVLEKSDANSASVVGFVIKHAPQLCLVPDAGPQRALALAYAATFRSSLHRSHGTALAARLAARLCSVLGQCAPSAAAIHDQNGWYPIHHAASFGEGGVLVLLATLFPYTAPFRDRGGMMPLQHALRRADDVGEDAVLHLGSTHPQALTCKALASARSSCSAELVARLVSLAKSHAIVIADSVSPTAEDTDSESCGSSVSSPPATEPSGLMQYAASLLLLHGSKHLADTGSDSDASPRKRVRA